MESDQEIDCLNGKEYRCTRPDIYERADKEGRQGHYIRAESKQEAIEKMKERFPDDENFTADLFKIWKNGRATRV